MTVRQTSSRLHLFGGIALRRGWVRALQLREGLNRQRAEPTEGRRRIGEILVAMDALTLREAHQVLAEQGVRIATCGTCGKRWNGPAEAALPPCPDCAAPLSPETGGGIHADGDLPSGSGAGPETADATIAHGDTLELRKGESLESMGIDPGVELDPVRDPDDLDRGERVGRERYEILVEVDRGGMGQILLAKDRDLKRHVAIKVLPAEKADRERVMRLITEAQVTAQLEHPNIVPVHDIQVDDRGRIFFTMKFVMGTTFKEIISVPHNARSEYTFRDMLRIFMDVCDAVSFAHDRGIVHRDLKPDNIMVGDYGEVLVMDWGLAKITGRGEQSRQSKRDIQAQLDAFAPHIGRIQASDFRTLEGTVMGTPAYMSPEQASGDIRKIGPPSDIFSLGAILYEVITARTPFTGRTAQEILRKVVHREPAAPSQVVPEVDPEIEAICLKGMAKDPSERYPTARELKEDIQAVLDGRGISVMRDSLGKRFRRGLRRHPTLARVAAILTLAFAGMAAAYYRQIRERREAENTHEVRLDAVRDERDVESALAAERERRLESRDRALAYLAEADRRAGEGASPETIREMLDAAATEATGWAPVDLALARFEAGRGESDAVLRRLDRLLAAEPGLAEGYRLRRRILLDGGEDERAQRDLEILQGLDGTPENLAVQAERDYGRGRWGEAAALWARIEGIGRVDVDAYGRWAHAARQLDPEGGGETGILDRAVEAYPDDPLPLVWRGHARLRGEAWEQAAADFAAAAERDPDDPGIRYLEAVSLYRLGSYDEAERACDAALAAGTDDGRIRFLRSRIRSAAGRFAPAREDLAVLLRENPSNLVLHYHHAVASIELGEIRGAEEALTWILREGGDDLRGSDVRAGDVRYQRARCYVRMGRPVEARNDLRVALQRNPDHPEAREMIGNLGDE